MKIILWRNLMSDLSYSELMSKIVEESKKQNKIIQVDYELTSHCNFRCKFCYVSNKYSVYDKQLSTDDWKQIIKESFDLGVVSCNFTGGEAITRCDYKELYQYAYDIGMRITALSNGYGIDEELIQFYSKRIPELISITLYGGCDETYEKICGIKDGFSKVKNNINKLVKNNIPVSLKISATPDISLNEYEAVSKFCKELGLKIALVKYISPMRTKESEMKMEWRLSAEKIKEIMKILDDPETTIIGNRHKERGMFECGFARNRFAVSHKGEIYGCLGCVGLSKVYQKNKLANQIKELRKEADELSNKMKMCINCKNAPTCNKCPGLIYSETGGFDKCSEYIKSLVNKRVL